MDKDLQEGTVLEDLDETALMLLEYDESMSACLADREKKLLSSSPIKQKKEIERDHD